MKIKPLTGQVLIEILPADSRSAGGIEIPERSRSPEEVQESHRNPEQPAPWQGIVREIGPWPKLPNGMMAMPEFGKGNRVIIRHNSGVAMQYGTSCRLRMVPQKDILATITESV